MKKRIIPYNPKLRAFARELRNNSTKAEIALWEGLKGGRLGVKFKRQFPILEYILDFYSKDIQLGIEVDGFTHDYKVNYDEIRQKEIESFGVKIIRFTNEDIANNIEGVLAVIQTTIDELQTKSP